MKKIIKRFKAKFIENEVGKIKIPIFPDSNIINKRIIFKGKVQGVGFRIQSALIGQNLDLYGWVKNLDNGDVEMEIQGTEEKINFLISEMKNTKRIRIDNMEVKEQSLNNSLEKFRTIGLE